MAYNSTCWCQAGRVQPTVSLACSAPPANANESAQARLLDPRRSFMSLKEPLPATDF